MNEITPSVNNAGIPVYVYEWKAWAEYLFPSIYSNSIRIEAKIRESNTDILKKLHHNHGYFLFHLNLTKTDSFFKNKDELLSRLSSMGITAINGELTDISKHYLQSTCKQIGINSTRASAEGDPNELLITKTNFNHGGRQEKRLVGSDFRRLRIGSRDYDSDIVYPVMERSKIKTNVWRNRNLIVEKYIANQENYFFRAYKLLNRLVVSEVINPNLIKKMTKGLERANYFFDLDNPDTSDGKTFKFSNVIADIIKLANAINLDFGAMDIVRSDDHEFYIIDVNSTPNWQSTAHMDILHFLAAGLSKNKTANLSTHL